MRAGLNFLAASLLVFSGPATLLAQDAAQLLQRVAASYKGLTEYHFEMDSESGLTTDWSQSWMRAHVMLVVAPGNRVRFDSVDQLGRYVVVSDGKTMWRAIGDTHEYSRTPLTGPVLEMTGGGSEGRIALRRLKFVVEQYWNVVDNLQSAQVLRQEKLDVDGADVACTVVRADYTAPRAAEGERSVTRTYWIDPSRNLFVQEESLTTGSLMAGRPYEYSESRRRLRFTKIAIGEPAPGALFTYTPPANYREVDTLEGVMQRRRQESIGLRGKSAPDFTAQTLDGKPVTLSALRGKPVLLDFWATWCSPCVEQMPALAALYREAKEQGLVLIGVDEDETPEKALAFVREKQYSWPNIYDHKDGAVKARYDVFGIPTLVLIDKDGTVAWYQTGSGPETDETVRAALRKVGVEVP